MRSSIIASCLILFFLNIHQSEAVRKRSPNHNNSDVNQRKISNSKHVRGLIKTSTGDGLYRGYKLTNGHRLAKIKIWKQYHNEGTAEEIEFHSALKGKVKKGYKLEDHDALNKKKNGDDTDSPTTSPTTLPTPIPTPMPTPMPTPIPTPMTTIIAEEPDDSSNRFKLDLVDDGSTSRRDEGKGSGPRIISNLNLLFLVVFLFVGAACASFFIFFAVTRNNDEYQEMDEDDRSKETSPAIPNQVDIFSA